MRYLSILIVLFLPSVTSADARLTPRPVDPIAADTLARAFSQSGIVRSLVATLEQSNVIVHIEASAHMPFGIAGTTRFVTSRGGYRYVRITIDAELPKYAITAILGHELQHACEVADSGVSDLEGMRQLFTLRGHRKSNYYETTAAIETEMRIRRELMGKTSSASEAAVTPK